MRSFAQSTRRMFALALVLLGVVTMVTGCLVVPVGPPVVVVPGQGHGWGHRGHWG
jgi:hypothetical protein